MMKDMFGIKETNTFPSKKNSPNLINWEIKNINYKLGGSGLYL